MRLRLAYLQIFLAVAAMTFITGCDSTGSDMESENEDMAEMSLTLSNTGGGSFPGDPSKLTIRAWNRNGENRALQTVDFPQEGESREVNVFIPPGDLFVGIMAHSGNGVVSFAAATDEAQSLTAGQSTNVDLGGDLNFWDFGYSIPDGQLSVGSAISFQTKERLSVQKADQLIEGVVDRFESDNQTGTVAYDSAPFTSTSEAGFDAEIEAKEAVQDSIRRSTRNTDGSFRIENESLLNSMYIRVELPVDSRWGDGPSSIIRPHPDSSALRLEDITSDTGITFGGAADVTITVTNVGTSAWEVTGVSGASGVAGSGDNPSLTLETGKRYRIDNNGGSGAHPFAIETGTDGDYLLNQDGDGSLEGNSGISYEEDSEGITFTYTQTLADQASAYQCNFHSVMEGRIQTGSGSGGGG